jgi:pleuromutilin/lincosamide/streptogramin A transport system ATP-binding/permease protein
METRLENLEVVKRSNKLPPIQMDLPNEESFKNKTVVRAEKVAGEISNQKLWNPTTFFLKGGDKVGIIGPNGSGKTTLLKKILNESDSDIYLSPAVKVGYFSQNMDVLDADNTIIENVKKESKQTETLIRIVLARLGFYQNDVEKKVKVLSGGERVKVSLAKIFVSDCNTLILDEPTNFLDVYALEALEELLVEYEGTVLIVSHDRSFISSIATKILAFEDNELIFFEGTYEEYLNRDQENERDIKADELARIENEIAAVLSQLSIEPTDELDKKFQELIKKKREIEN